ncbi:hypothetical protein [Rhodococcus sp. 077-4]|uniref:hypothetical protein n=1 Tax=Rhodococcus sp. 077-4 TaxID=2789271 RepID=UPI0039F641B5
MAEVMSTLDFGELAAEVLTMLVAAEPDACLAVDARQLWSDDTRHHVRIFARVFLNEVGERVVGGVAYDCGLVDEELVGPGTVGDVVASSVAPPRTWTAIVDLSTLETLHWHGPSPDSIAWKFDGADSRPRVHPDDDATVEALASATRKNSAEHASAAVRFRHPDGGYARHTVTCRPIVLEQRTGGLPKLALVTLTDARQAKKPGQG